MRWIVVLSLVLLASCQTAEEKARKAAEARQASYHEKCVGYGLSPGTEAYADCRIQFDLGERHERAAKKAIIFQHLLGR